MINFEFYITCKVQSGFPFLQMDVWLCQHFLFKRLSLLHWTAFAGTLVKRWQTHSQGVSGRARPAGDEVLVLCGITLPSCSLTAVLMSARVLQLSSLSRPFGWFSLFASPSWSPACRGLIHSSSGRKMGYSGPHCLAHYWSRPGVQAREGGLETLKPPACVMRQVPAPFSTCCLLCTFSSNILPRVFTCHQREGLALTESFYFTKGRATEQGKVGRKGVWQAGLEAVGFFGVSFGDRRPLHGFLHFLHV